MCGRYCLAKPYSLTRRVIRPGDNAPVITSEFSIDIPSSYASLIWGFTPTWMNGRLINARCETIDSSPVFGDFFHRNGRCIVPAFGFYERGKLFSSHTGGFYFAGLHNGNQFVIITTPANSKVLPVHSRMPAILTDIASRAWLQKPIKQALFPYESVEQYNQQFSETCQC